jgi:hypothetical protein
MKFNYSVLLLISAILAQSHENSEDNECYTKLECKTKEITEKVPTDRKYMRCAELIDNKFAMLGCIYKVAGLRDDQIPLLLNIIFNSINCGSGLESPFKRCIGKCASDKSCKETCADNRTERSMQCLANRFNVKDFDVNKSVQCSKQCDQDTLSEIMDCDMKCNEPLYKKISSDDEGDDEDDDEGDEEDIDYDGDDGDQDSMPENDKSSKKPTTRVTITTKSSSNNPKFTSKVNTSSTNSSTTISSSTISSSATSPSTNSSSTRSVSGVSSLPTGSFSAISIPILLLLIFIA